MSILKEKICAKFVSGPQNLKVPPLYPNSLGLEGARRIFSKVTIDVSAGMGGICVSRHKDPRCVPAAVQRPPWPLIGRPKSGRNCYKTPTFRGGSPTKGTRSKHQKKATKGINKKFPLCPTSYVQTWRLPVPRDEPKTFPSQRHCLPTRLQAISDRCMHRDGIDIWSNMGFIHY